VTVNKLTIQSATQINRTLIDKLQTTYVQIISDCQKKERLAAA
jgi:hypothetical protein